MMYMALWMNLSSLRMLLRGSYISMAILSSNAFYMSVSNIRTYTLCDSRWDTNVMDQLPYYMKLCFLALHNSINEMAFDILKEQGFHVVRYLRKVVCMDWTSKFILIYLLQFVFLHKYDYNSTNSLFYHYKCFSGQIYVNLICWRQSGTTVDINQAFKNIFKMHGFRHQDQLY